MNILFLTARLPYPLDSGASIRNWNLFASAAGHHSVTLLTFLHSKRELAVLPVMQSLTPAARIETAASALRGATDGWTIAGVRVVRTRFAFTREGGWRHEIVVRCRCLEG